MFLFLTKATVEFKGTYLISSIGRGGGIQHHYSATLWMGLRNFKISGIPIEQNFEIFILDSIVKINLHCCIDIQITTGEQELGECIYEPKVLLVSTLVPSPLWSSRTDIITPALLFLKFLQHWFWKMLARMTSKDSKERPKWT